MEKGAGGSFMTTGGAPAAAPLGKKEEDGVVGKARHWCRCGIGSAGRAGSEGRA